MSRRLSVRLFNTKIIDDNVEIRMSHIENAGKGAFARRLILRGTVLGEYKGQPCVPHATDGDYVLDIDLWRKYDGVERRVQMCIDAKHIPTSTWTRYINSVTNSQPNVEFYVFGEWRQERVGVRAIKNIQPGTELLLDYGNQFF
jgi:hypothetical protein